LINHPRDPNLLYNLAIIQQQQGKIEDARRTLEKARNQAPDDDTLNLMLAELSLETGDVQKAWDAFIQVSEEGRQTARSQFIKGMIHARMGDDVQAEQALRTAIALTHETMTTLAALGFVLARQNQADEARTMLARAQAQPATLDGQLQIAETCLALGDAKQAQQIADQLQREHPQDPQILALLGKAETKLTRFGDAESAFTRALAAPNAGPWTRVAYAEMLFAAQREDEAFTQASKAEEELNDLHQLSGEPVRDPSLYNLLATLYARRGQMILAHKYLNLSLQANPMQPKVRELLQKIMEK
jgi:Flp pilus assembly protein TadD